MGTNNYSKSTRVLPRISPSVPVSDVKIGKQYIISLETTWKESKKYPLLVAYSPFNCPCKWNRTICCVLLHLVLAQSKLDYTIEITWIYNHLSQSQGGYTLFKDLGNIGHLSFI